MLITAETLHFSEVSPRRVDILIVKSLAGPNTKAEIKISRSEVTDGFKVELKCGGRVYPPAEIKDGGYLVSAILLASPSGRCDSTDLMVNVGFSRENNLRARLDIWQINYDDVNRPHPVKTP